MVNQTPSKTVVEDLEQPLIPVVEEEEDIEETLLTKLKLYSAWIGLSCGIFVQLSTLGANFLLVAIYGEESVVARTQQEAMIFSLSWSFFTSCLALLVLSLVRGLVQATLDVARQGETMDRDSLMMAIEVRYVVGALTGVCFAWALTDVMLGMESLAAYSLGTLVVALVWSKAMVWLFLGKTKKEQSYEDLVRLE